MTPPDTPLGQITLAVLKNEIGHLTEALDRYTAEVRELRHCYEEDHERMTEMAVVMQTMIKTVDALTDKVDRIDQRDKLWNGSNTLIALIGTVLGSLLGGSGANP